MAQELELKAVVTDPARLRQALSNAGAVLRFQGEMSDRRFDRGGELTARDQVLRVRSCHYPDGRVESVMGWKGPMRVSQGFKEREELELPIAGESDPPEALLRALGYEVVHGIDGGSKSIASTVPPSDWRPIPEWIHSSKSKASRRPSNVPSRRPESRERNSRRMP